MDEEMIDWKTLISSDTERAAEERRVSYGAPDGGLCAHEFLVGSRRRDSQMMKLIEALEFYKDIKTWISEVQNVDGSVADEALESLKKEIEK